MKIHALEVSAMTRKSRFAAVLGVGILSFLLILSAGVACKKTSNPGEAKAVAPEKAKEVNAVKEGVNEIAGTVKSALGKYFYIGQLPGFDILADGAIEGGDASTLLGKDVKVKAAFNREKPSLLIAQSIEIKESETQFKSVFSKADAVAPADFFLQKDRADYAEIKITGIAKSADWEGKGKGKVSGKLIVGADGKPTAISVLYDKGKETARIIVDSISDYAAYYLKKLRLFDTTWFYFNIKDSVDPKLRAKAKEVFHAEIVFIGLY
jgi:hypothetical protein